MAEALNFGTGLGAVDEGDYVTIDLEDEAVEDIVSDLLKADDKLSWTYDDSDDTLTIDTTALDEEEVEDAVADLLSGGTGVSLDYDDADSTLTIDGFSGSHDDLTDISSDDHHSKTTSGDIVHDDTDGGTVSDAHHSKTTSEDIVHDDTEGGTDPDAHHSKTTSDEIVHDDTDGGTVSDAHHSRYTDQEARDAATPLPISVTHANWADGLSNEEVHRIDVPSDKALEVRSIDLQLKGGGSESELSVDVYDDTDSSEIASTSAGDTADTGTPIGTSDDGATVIVRISNDTGDSQTASLTIGAYLV